MSSGFVYTIPYILLTLYLEFLALLTWGAKDDAMRLRYTLFAVGGFFFFFAFRGFILSDWIIYYPYFFDCSLSDIYNYQINEQGLFEPGFTVLTVFCRGIVRDYHFFVFICSLIDTVLLLRFFRKRVDNISLALLIYFVFEGLTISTNLMRNSISILIFLNAIPYLQARKHLQYFSLCLFAMSFHMSAAFYLPLYFFIHRSINRWVYLAVFIVSNLVFLLHISIFESLANLLGFGEIFSSRIRAYTELYNISTGISIGYLERLFTGLLVFLYMDKLRSLHKENNIYINAILIYFCMFFLFSEFRVMSQRLCTLFVFGYWMVWLNLIKVFSIENNRRLFIGFVFVYCVLRIAQSTYLPDFEYDNVLFGAKSYQQRLYIHNKTFDGP